MGLEGTILKTLFVTWLLVVVSGLVVPTPVAAIEYVLPTQPVAQGEVARIVLKGVAPGSEVKGFWLGRPLPFFQIAEGEFLSLLGVDLNLTPGNHELEVQVLQPGTPPIRRHDNLQVASKDYGVERLQLPQNMVTLDATTLKRVRREQARFSGLWKKQSSVRHWTKPFILPVVGKRLSPFGLRRIINDEPRSPHSGLDLRAALGDPVEASNSGRVVLVGEFFFSGNAVVIDHGLGMYTMYFHLSQLKVSQGDRVEQGSVIGLAGATGRASGPHLHWGARLGGARIDPLELLRVTSE
jgi:murein DD-endopeptidase MepM/ murein hydrolase activator NlpD